MNSYRISELARRFGLSRSTLLYYHRIGLLCPGGRTEANYRCYTEQDLARLERICTYRAAGISLEQIADLLGTPPEQSTILAQRLSEISREMAELNAQRKLVSAMLQRLPQGAEACGLDSQLWLTLQKACGLDEAALARWHREFERRAPEAHHGFLLGLGLSEKEAIQVRLLTKSVEHNKMKMEYFFEVFESLPRQGPGCEAATLRALCAVVEKLPQPASVLDIGCGSGVQSRLLARHIQGKVVAIDNHLPVLKRLARVAAEEGLAIETREASMLEMPFAEQSFDLLWAEGSIFIIGLERGLREFRRFIRPGGFLAFTELCWFTDTPSAEPKAFFDAVYPDIRNAEQITELAQECGYTQIESFSLPDSAWWEQYYNPMQTRLTELRARHGADPEAEEVYGFLDREIALFRQHSAEYGYRFVVLQRPKEE